MKIVALVGSLRKDSYNLQLVNTIKHRYSDKFSLTIPDIGTLPFFNQDEEANPGEPVKQFKKAIAESDGVLLATPEYNWSVPGVLKNALDWLSRGEREMIGKPTMILGASTGMFGTLRAQLHLREILVSPGIQAKILPPAENAITIPAAKQKFDDTTRNLSDASTLQFIDSVIHRFMAFVG